MRLWSPGTSLPSMAGPCEDKDDHVRTYSPKAGEVVRAWHVIDADGLVLGRIATEVARLLRGKHRPIRSAPRHR